ncbi:MAG: patatin-like phospholipase family protein [Candidatus Omnitrophica bacterium]|nr:patatin-like phospholipase family protein [Candidatus Omnitrophota bacterium]
MSIFRKRKVALALGGGAARGLANLGVLKVFEEERIPIDLVVGTSIGGLIGAAYCLGVPIGVMEKSALNFKLGKLVDLGLSNTAITKGKKLARIVAEFTDKKTFADARIPFAITATDIETGDELVYTKGNLQDIVRASCSWPGIFPPVKIYGRKLADGGIRNSIPVKMARRLGATTVIAVDIGFCVRKGEIKNLIQMFIQSIQIMGEELDEYQSMQADIIIKPKLTNIDQLAFNRAKEAIREGEAAARKSINAIRKKVGRVLWKR